eukprot:111271-Prymnesium_polylepis.1
MLSRRRRLTERHRRVNQILLVSIANESSSYVTLPSPYVCHTSAGTYRARSPKVFCEARRS